MGISISTPPGRSVSVEVVGNKWKCRSRVDCGTCHKSEWFSSSGSKWGNHVWAEVDHAIKASGWFKVTSVGQRVESWYCSSACLGSKTPDPVPAPSQPGLWGRFVRWCRGLV